MPDEVFEARLLPRRIEGDVEVFRMRVLDSNGNTIDLTGGGSGGSLPDGGPGVLTRSTEDGPESWVDVVEISADTLPFTPVGTIAASDVQSAIAEVASEAASGLSTHSADSTAVHGISNTANLKGVVVWTSGGIPTRPTGFVSVEWVGPADPAVNAVDGDTWVNTA